VTIKGFLIAFIFCSSLILVSKKVKVYDNTVLG